MDPVASLSQAVTLGLRIVAQLDAMKNLERDVGAMKILVRSVTSVLDDTHKRLQQGGSQQLRQAGKWDQASTSAQVRCCRTWAPHRGAPAGVASGQPNRSACSSRVRGRGACGGAQGGARRMGYHALCNRHACKSHNALYTFILT